MHKLNPLVVALVAFVMASLSAATSAHAGGGWAWAHEGSSSTPYPADPLYSYSSAGGEIWIEREGDGLYTVTFEDLQSPPGIGGNAQVVAYGPGDEYCNVRSWSERSVFVGCYAPGGQRADSAFVVALTHLPSGSAIDPNAGYLWSASELGQDVPAFWSWNGSGGDNFVHTREDDLYSIRFVGIGAPAVVVTAYDPGLEGLYCSGVAFADPPYTDATVACFDGQGNPRRARFSISVGAVYGFESNGHAYGIARRVRAPKTFPTPWVEHPRQGVALEFAPFDHPVLVRLTSGAELTARVPVLPSFDKTIAFVTAYPNDVGMRCKIRSWLSVELSTTDVNFHCADKFGQAVDRVGWTVVYASLQSIE